MDKGYPPELQYVERRDEPQISPEISFANDAPVFETAADGLAHLDEVEAAAIKQLHEEAQRQMEADQEDPRTQNYFMRTDKKTVVKDDKEYGFCLKNQIPMKVIPYGHALQLLKEEEARHKNRLKAKAKKKAAKKSRKRNR